MLVHPAVKQLFAGIGEGVAVAAANPSQLDTELRFEQAPQCSPKRRPNEGMRDLEGIPDFRKQTNKVNDDLLCGF